MSNDQKPTNVGGTQVSASREGDALAGSHKIVDLADGIFGQQQAGWLVTIETEIGLVQIDTGDEPDESIAAIRSKTDAPFEAIIFSHGHQRYNQSARFWVIDQVKQTGHAPRVIGHRNLLRRHARYHQSTGLQNRIIERQFRYPAGTFAGRRFPFMTPTEVLDDTLIISTPRRTIEVFHAPSETDDAIGVWIPEDRILYGGPGCIPFFPNVGSPQRPLRDPVRWADTLDRMAQYPAELLIREFGKQVEGAANVQEYLTSTARALRWCHDTAVELMNQGLNAHQIVNRIELPPEIFDKPWLAEGYTAIEHVFRDVFRSQFGWWEDFNPTSLHPADPDEVAAEVKAAITDPDAVIAHARSLAAEGKLKLALHVIDLVALGTDSEPTTIEARTFKAELCRLAAEELTPSYVSKSLYLNGANELEALNSPAS